MADPQSNRGNIRSRMLVWAVMGAAVLVVLVAWVLVRGERHLSPDELAHQWVESNVDTVGEEIAGFLTAQQPVLRELGGEYVEGRINDMVEWRYSVPREISPQGNGLYEVIATASVDFSVDPPGVDLLLGSRGVRADMPFKLRVSEPDQAVTDWELDLLGAMLDLDLPDVPPVPERVGEEVKENLTDIVTKAPEVTTLIDKATGSVASIVNQGPGQESSTNVVNADVVVPDALEKQGDVIPAQSGDPTHADCIAGAQEDSSVDAVRLETITNTDPASLTDIQRKNWFEFFRRNASSLKTVCISLWTEPVTGENAAMRNEEYRGSENENGCLTRVERYAREKDVKERARWVDTLELLERPY